MDDGVDVERRDRQDRLFGAEIAGYVAQRRSADQPESIARAVRALRWAERIIAADDLVEAHRKWSVIGSEDLRRAWRDPSSFDVTGESDIRRGETVHRIMKLIQPLLVDVERTQTASETLALRDAIAAEVARHDDA